MRNLAVALVGPSSRALGGIAGHTTMLVQRLKAEGILVGQAEWGRQFPKIFHPSLGTQFTQGEREAHRDDRALHWNRPDTWWSTGIRLRRSARTLILVVSHPLQFPAFFAIVKAFRGPASSGRRVVAIVHNVLPHEESRAARPLMHRVLRLADRVVVHSETQAELARALGARSVDAVGLPFHPPWESHVASPSASEERRNVLGFFGYVRHYKGLDVLLEALARSANRPQLIVLGEFWEPLEQYSGAISRLGLQGHVEIRPRYASGDEIVDFLGRVDALVLPYRSGTGSQQPRIAFARGVPVIASRVSGLEEQIRTGIDGLLVPPAAPRALAGAIDNFYTADNWLRLRRGVQRPDYDSEWRDYLRALLAH